MDINLYYCFLFIIFHSKAIDGYYIRGGTISWKPLGQNKVTFYERLGYQYKQGPGCDSGLEGQVVSSLNDNFWHCSSGCTTDYKISDVNYYCGSYNAPEDWENGDKTFTYTFPSTGPFVVSYIEQVSAPRIQTTVDLRVRSDTNTPNYSPVTTSKPVYKIPFGCSTKINIPVVDPDNDNVTCRWASAVECGSVCQKPPNADLDVDTCTLTIDATDANGYTVNTQYYIGLTIEDMATTSIKLDNEQYTTSDVISGIPLQFTVDIFPAGQNCNNAPVFTSDTPSDKQLIQLPDDGVLDLDIYAETNGTAIRIQEFILSNPNGLKLTSAAPDDKGRSNIWYSKVTWSPRAGQEGLHLLCAQAVDDTGMYSEQRCFFVKVDSVNYCDPNPCSNNGVCMSHGNSYTCSCKSDFYGLNCESRESASCDGPDESYCICDMNGKPAKVPFPKPEVEALSSRDLISGIVGFPIGAVIGVAVCSIWHHWFRKKCCVKRSRVLGSRGSSVGSSDVGVEDLESISTPRDVKPIFGATPRVTRKQDW